MLGFGGVVFGLFGVFLRDDVQIHGGMRRDVLERDAVLAENIGVAVRPDVRLGSLKLGDDSLEFGMFLDAWRGFVECAHDIPKVYGVERPCEYVCAGELAIDAVDELKLFESREYGFDRGDGINALNREGFGSERRVAGTEVAHEGRENLEGGVFADEDPLVLRARGLVKATLKLERVHVLHDIAGLDAKEEHHPGEVEPQERDGQDTEGTVKDAVVRSRFERDIDIEAEAEFGDLDEDAGDGGRDDRVFEVHARVGQELEDDEACDRKHEDFGDDRRERVVGNLARDELRCLED